MPTAQNNRKDDMVSAMNSSLFPERPLLVSPSLASRFGLEQATLLSVLSELVRGQSGQLSQGYHWFQLTDAQLAPVVPFWNQDDISRISQSLRAQNALFLHSAPYHQSQQLIFAFNEQVQEQTQPATSQPHHTRGATPISPNWQPSHDVMQLLSQHGINAEFAQQQLPEFVNYWRESGESQRSWGSKFVQQVRKQWAFHQQQQARQQRSSQLDSHWQPSPQICEQLSRDGIPSSFINQCLARFIQYHQGAGTQHHAWDSLFYRWVGEDWDKRETPFIEKKQNAPMSADWQPAPHTLQYLRENCGVDDGFIQETVAEFVHKWLEKQAYHSEWGNLFAKHVIEQWRFVQAGIERNPTAKLITADWCPTTDCTSVLIQQAGINAQFIQDNIPEFILYWQNRGEARHSWDTVFIRHIKHLWAKRMTSGSNEGQQADHQPVSTRARSLAEDLNDTSWAV